MKNSTVLSFALGALLLAMAPGARAAENHESNGCGHKNAGGFRALSKRKVALPTPPGVNQSIAGNTELTSHAAPQSQPAPAAR